MVVDLVAEAAVAVRKHVAGERQQVVDVAVALVQVALGQISHLMLVVTERMSVVPGGYQICKETMIPTIVSCIHMRPFRIPLVNVVGCRAKD